MVPSFYHPEHMFVNAIIGTIPLFSLAKKEIISFEITSNSILVKSKACSEALPHKRSAEALR